MADRLVDFTAAYVAREDARSEAASREDALRFLAVAAPGIDAANAALARGMELDDVLSALAATNAHFLAGLPEDEAGAVNDALHQRIADFTRSLRTRRDSPAA